MNRLSCVMASALFVVAGWGHPARAQQPSLDELLRDATGPAIAAPEAAEADEAPKAPAAETPAPAESAPSAPPGLVELLDNLQNLPPSTETPAGEAPAEAAPATADAAGEEAPVPEEADLNVAARELAAQEEVRLQAMELEGRKALEKAREAFKRGEYAQAIGLYEEALIKIPVRPATQKVREEAVYERAEAAYQAARQHYARGDYAQARQQAQLAAEIDEAGHGRAVRALLERITAYEARSQARAERPVPVEQAPEVVEKQTQIEQLFARGKQWFDLGDYDRAEALFEQILLKDPYHLDAMRFLKRIEERRLEASNMRRRSTVEDFTQDVRERWNPPIRRPMFEPSATEPGGEKQVQTASQKLRERMQNIVIPKVDFRQANIVDVINYLREASVANDPEQMGVNIIQQLDVAGAMPTTSAAPAAPATTDPWALPATGEAALPVAPEAPSGTPDIPAISITLRRVSLLDAIKYVTEVAGLKYRIEENAVIITPRDVVTNVITRMYPVMPSIMTFAVERREQEQQRGGEFVAMGGGATIKTTPDEDIKAMFERMGVPFPVGTSISYNSAISQLIVTNTAENLEILERILGSLDIVPKQVEIEARFVEIGQTDLDELGFEWMLTDDWQIANKRGPGPLASRERVQMNSNAAGGGFTRGLRYFTGPADSTTPSGSSLATAAGMSGTLFSISSILTNPEVTFVLHALAQRGGTDLLSAPRVTTRSGVNAQIQVVEEIIYPTEWEEQSVESEIDTSFRTPIPSTFETREVGVILNVTPTVGPDGYTIDLTLVPEVAELSGWIDYGPADRFPILQPIFASRNVTASIVLWDNQTIVMGGLIRDEVIRFSDKIPILGDIPLLGRFFRSEGERSDKRNLMVFVTARLVNPAGYPIHEEKDRAGERW